jgi:hypothetical protein
MLETNKIDLRRCLPHLSHDWALSQQPIVVGERHLFGNFLFGPCLQAVRKNYDPSGYKLPTALVVGEVAFQAKNNRAPPLCISLFICSSPFAGAGACWF